jgi:Ser/Thr protein kinase RdoA (MazF antagonist)
VSDLEDLRTRVLPHYPDLEGGTVELHGSGLINRTYLVERGGVRHVLQKINRIFPPGIHDNIEAVTAHLAGAGFETARLVRTRAGRLCLELGEGEVWRVLTHVRGVSFDVIGTLAQAHAGGRLIGRFHAALAGLSHAFVGMRLGVHDTPRHLARLAEAMATLGAHRLHAELAPFGAEVLAAAEKLPALPALPDITGHGDLKFNNLMFAGATPPGSDQAVCLIDFDTVGPVALAFELGDAWRSWCNRAGEDVPVAQLDLEVFRASLEGYREGLGRLLSEAERRALLLGVEWVSLELAARFGGDALFESYFGWDPKRFAGRGEHNLVRARGQWSLYHALESTRGERARMLGIAA